jgi:hypothetical protein
LAFSVKKRPTWPPLAFHSNTGNSLREINRRREKKERVARENNPVESTDPATTTIHRFAE